MTDMQEDTITKKEQDYTDLESLLEAAKLSEFKPEQGYTEENQEFVKFESFFEIVKSTETAEGDVQEKNEVQKFKEDIADEEEAKKVSEGDQEIISKIQKHLGDKVSDVIISKRLTDSASCIVLPKHEPGAQLRKILEASGQTLGSSNPIFEINIKHKLVKKLKDMKGKQFNSFVDFLYDYAVIAEGGSPQDPSKYLRQLDKYLS